jgi:hypothetical protein
MSNYIAIDDLLLHEYYLNKSKEKYGQTFDYGDSIFINSESILKLRCNIHNKDFSVSLRQHFRSNHGGCIGCDQDQKNRDKLIRFIAAAREKHGDQFDYHLVKDARRRQVLTIICKDHNEFNVSKEIHLAREHGGCFGCQNKIKLINKNSTLIDRLKMKYNDKFDYSETNFSEKPFIKIKCKEHGVFTTELRLHERGMFGGCSECLSDHVLKGFIASFIKKAIDKFGDQYSYESVNKLPKSGKVTINCKDHGNFQANHIQHLRSNYGCCEGCRVKQANEKAFAKIIKNRGQDFFSKFNYINSQFFSLVIPTEVICLSHGAFVTNILNHLKLKGGGCLKCENIFEKVAAKNLRVKIARREKSALRKKFLAKYKEAHGERFDYSDTVFENNNLHINVKCIEHGIFTVRRESHWKLSHGGCCQCKEKDSNNKKVNNFVSRATKKHGGQFLYYHVSLKEIENGLVTVECVEHGIFKTDREYHIRTEFGMCVGCKQKGRLELNKQKFIQDACKKYGDQFDYSKFEYLNQIKPSILICAEHGEFKASAHAHLHKMVGGCSGCKEAQEIDNTTKKYVILFKKTHKNLYVYTDIKLKRLTDRIELNCETHGNFSITGLRHLKGFGCPECDKIKLQIATFRKKYGDQFDYSAITQIPNLRTPLKIRCIKHNQEFKQGVNYHLRTSGCKACIKEATHLKQEPKALKRLTEYLGDNFDTSESRYVGYKENITVKCKTHGYFERKYSLMFRGKFPCYKCENEHITKEKTEYLVDKIKKVHGDKYDLSAVSITKMDAQITVSCPQHGAFSTTVDNLLSSYGCSVCYRESKLENTRDEWIELFRAKHGSKYVYNKLPEKIIKNRPITVTCLIHSDFKTRVETHLKSGCPTCNRINRRTFLFWKSIKKKYGNTLIYKKLDLIKKPDQMVTLTCAKHGDFTNKARNHLKAAQGCQACRFGISTDIIKESLIKRFGDRFIVSTIVYLGLRKPLKLHCRQHGSISTTPTAVMRDSFNCPHCEKEKRDLISRKSVA